MADKKPTLMIVRFEYGNMLNSELADWLIHHYAKLRGEGWLEGVGTMSMNRPQVDHARNCAVRGCLESGIDYMLQIDSDMIPDLYAQKREGVVPFLQEVKEFILKREPGILGAPYCMAPPKEEVNVFQFSDIEGGSADPQFDLQKISRLDASQRKGVGRVDAIGCGLTLWDMRLFSSGKLPKPFFQFEYRDEAGTEFATTEDVFCTRAASYAGFPVYCAWSSWAGHLKQKVVGQPAPLNANEVAQIMRRQMTQESDHCLMAAH